MFKINLFYSRFGEEVITLPFIPVVGMHIRTEKVSFAMRVVRVVYDARSGIFEVTLEE